MDPLTQKRWHSAGSRRGFPLLALRICAGAGTFAFYTTNPKPCPCFPAKSRSLQAATQSATKRPAERRWDWQGKSWQDDLSVQLVREEHPWEGRVSGPAACSCLFLHFIFKSRPTETQSLSEVGWERTPHVDTEHELSQCHSGAVRCQFPQSNVYVRNTNFTLIVKLL